MIYQHRGLAEGRWQQLSFIEQMANIGSEVGRALSWRAKDNPIYCQRAFERALEWGNRIPIGLFYKENKPTYDSEEPVLKKGPLVKQPIGLDKEKFSALMNEFY